MPDDKSELAPDGQLRSCKSERGVGLYGLAAVQGSVSKHIPARRSDARRDVGERAQKTEGQGQSGALSGDGVGSDSLWRLTISERCAVRELPQSVPLL